MKRGVPVYLEIGTKRSFAVAVQWPGWARSGHDQEDALARLAEYGPRYASVVGQRRLGFKAPSTASAFDVVERIAGDATTDFGAPGTELPGDRRPLGEDELRRLLHILRACWAAFDRSARAARGVELRKGPRGGGRDLHKIALHVAEAEQGYVAALSGQAPRVSSGDPLTALAPIHEAALAAVQARVRGELPDEGARGGRRWHARHFIRRTAWHALDHAWEIEDRAGPEPSGGEPPGAERRD